MPSLSSELPGAEMRLVDLDHESIKSVDWWNLTNHLSSYNHDDATLTSNSYWCTAAERAALSLRHQSQLRCARQMRQGAFTCKNLPTVDTAIIPRLLVMDMVSQLPSADFGILQSALLRTGLAAELADTNGPHSTLFAPSDTAFRKLGKRMTGFLFDQDGLVYLHTLLKYHMVPSQNLWFGAFEKLTGGTPTSSAIHSHSSNLVKGSNSFLLYTMLAGRERSIEVLQFGGLVSILPDRLTRVAVQDEAASSALAHFVDGVLLPGIVDHKGSAAYEAEILDVGELKSRLVGC